jgi:hypothetical protein
MIKNVWKVFALILFVSPVYSANGPFGLGLILGEPTGISAKYWIDSERRTAIDAGLAWSLSGNNNLHLHGDYLFHNYRLLHDAMQIKKGKLPVYFGVGGRAELRENRDDKVGIRVPFGAAYLVDGAPLEIFAELVPVVDLAPDTDMDLEGGIGIRFYF